MKNKSLFIKKEESLLEMVSYSYHMFKSSSICGCGTFGGLWCMLKQNQAHAMTHKRMGTANLKAIYGGVTR